MTSMTWHQMNALDTLTYDMKALLEVVSDGLLNQECPSNPEDSAGVIRQAVDKLEKVRGIHEQMWEQQREAKARSIDDDGTNEDADEEESFDTKELFSADETDIDPKQMSETVYEAQKRRYESATSFDVKELKRHEDGSVTYQVSGSDEKMKELFEVFFTHALINGIKHTEDNNKKEMAKIKALNVARDLERFLHVWEWTEGDYDPSVKTKREELTKALNEAGV